MDSSEANSRCDELNAAANAEPGVRWMARQASPGDWEVIRVQVPGLARKRPTSGKWEPRKTAPVPGPDVQPDGPDLDEAFGPVQEPGSWEPPTPQAAPQSRPWAPPAAPRSPPPPPPQSQQWGLPPSAPQSPPPAAPQSPPFAPHPMSKPGGHSWKAAPPPVVPPSSPMPEDLGTLKRSYGELPPPPPDFGQRPNVPAPDPPQPPDEPPPWASLPEPDSAPPAPPPTINPNWLKRLRRED